MTRNFFIGLLILFILAATVDAVMALMETPEDD